MRRRGRLLAAVVAAAVCVLLVAGLLGRVGSHHESTEDNLASSPRPDGLVYLRTVTYAPPLGGRAMAALVATPRAAASRGCVIWENGLTSNDDAAAAAQGFAALGLTTFSIDLRHRGSRAAGAADAGRAATDAKSLAELIRGTAADLHSAVGYLEKQPYCRRTVAYAGVSLGGIIGTFLAATDHRVRAVALMSTPGTFRATLTTDNGPFLPGVAHDPARLAAALQTLSPLDPVRYVGRIAPRPVLILSGVDDKTVVIADARRLAAAARQPKTIVDYPGGHDPFAGPASSSNGQAVASFLLRYVVEPTYGVSGNGNGTFAQG